MVHGPRVEVVHGEGDHSLRVLIDGTEVLRHHPGTDMPADHAPRPYLHPIRSLGGEEITADRPPDHPWHRGLSVAVADLDGTNLWGGGTFVDGSGYRDLADHGRMVHDSWRSRVAGCDAYLLERVRWLDRRGLPLVAERRLHVVQVEPGGWALTVRSALQNVSGRPLRWSSPEGNGRVDAAYGGLFWRAASGLSDADWYDVDGRRDGPTSAAWLAIANDRVGARLVSHVPGAPWFVRCKEYPGVCFPSGMRSAWTFGPGARAVLGGRLEINDRRTS